MSVSTKIIDGEGSKIPVGVRNTESFGNGIKAYTHEGNPLGLGTAFFMNDIYGTALNQNAAVGGTPDKIHDGIDSTLWTGSAIAGTWTFNSAAQAHAGTRSTDATATVDNSVAQYAKGSNLTIASYTSVSGWIYLTGFSGSGTKHINIYGWDTSLAAQEGATLNIDDYINTGILGSWQQFVIPIADFTFTALTLDAIRVRTVDIGAGPPPNYYLDDLQFEETGGGITFSAGPPNGDKWRVVGISYVFADAYAGTVADGTMPSIPYDGFLGVGTLAVGTTVKRIQFDEVRFTNTTTDLIDYLATAAPKTMISGSDGTNTWVRVEATYPYPVLLDGKKGDRYELTINDDLSGLLYYKASIVFGVEIGID